MENGKWKMVKAIIICALFLFLPYIYIYFAPIYQFDDIYVKKANVLQDKGKLRLRITAGKNFYNCPVVSTHSIKDKYYYTNRTLNELQNSCVSIMIYDVGFKDIFRIKDILKDKIFVY